MSPVAHCGIGILGWRYFSDQKNYKTFFLFILIANFPDIDFLLNLFLENNANSHQLYTHNVFFVFFTVLVTAPFFKRKKEWLGITLVAYSHLLLDILVIDRVSPIGIRLFYPLSDKLFNIGVFPNLLRGSLAEIVSQANLAVIMLETTLFILPLLFLFRKDLIKSKGRFPFWKR